jgi:sigma-B regulation protein RsbU (phosphoserine phosphatase)
VPGSEDPRSDVNARLERALHALERQTRAVDRLNLLVEASKQLTSTLDLCQVFDSILEVATRHTGADRATLFLVDVERGQLWSLVAQGLEHREIRLPIGRGLAGWVAKEGLTVNLPEAHADERFESGFDEIFGYRTRSILVMPVRGRTGRVIGVLEMLNKRGGSFTTADIELVEGISAHAAIALENAQLHKASIARQRLEQELQLARTIHQGLLPAAAPRIDGFEVAVRHDACSHVGGDYYDFIALGPTAHLFLIADVEGRGAPAALVASAVHTALHTLADNVRSIESIAAQLNERVRQTTQGARHMTAFLGLLDVPAHTLHYINAGHPPPVVIGKGGATPLQQGGVLMGAFPGAEFHRGSRRLEKGDVVLGYTDGITESTGLGGGDYGLERLIMIAASRSGSSARELVDAVYGDVESHASCNGGLDADDRLLLAIRTL